MPPLQPGEVDTRGSGSVMTSVKQSSSAFDRNVEGNKSLYLEMMADLVTDTVNRHESTLSQHPHLNYHPPTFLSSSCPSDLDKPRGGDSSKVFQIEVADGGDGGGDGGSSR